MKIILIVIVILVILHSLKMLKKHVFKRNKKLLRFKDKFLSTKSSIDKIFERNNEKIFLNPEINIIIGIYDDENEISQKANIHRARLAKFKRSKLNGEYIYLDNKKRLFKYVNNEKIFLD